MRRKALLIGVLPSPFEGPWVPLGGRVWTYEPDTDLAGNVVIEVQSNGSITRHPLFAEMVTISGEYARGVIIADPGVSQVTVNLNGGN